MPTVLANWPAQPGEIELARFLWPGDWEIIDAKEHTSEELIALAVGFDVVVGRLSPELLRAADRLRFIHVLGHGVDRLGEGEVAAILRERKIPIARANPASITISEFVLMSMIALNRRLIDVHQSLAYRGDWSQARLRNRMNGAYGGEIYGQTLCIAGLGDIGKAIAEKAKALGMRGGALTRTPQSYNPDALGLDFLSGLDAPEESLARSDHLVTALPLTPETENFLSASRIATMRKGSFLINIGRSSMVDQKAMFEALSTGHLAGAAIDVWPDEESKTYPSAYPIHHFNVIMTPHSCAITKESRTRALEMVAENLRRSWYGQPLLNASPLRD